MIRHTIRIRFSAETDAAARTELLGALIRLGDHLGHVSAFTCGPIHAAEAGAGTGFTHAFAVVLETEAACAAYRALPDYAAILERLARAAEGGEAGLQTGVGPAG